MHRTVFISIILSFVCFCRLDAQEHLISVNDSLQIKSSSTPDRPGYPEMFATSLYLPNFLTAPEGLEKNEIPYVNPGPMNFGYYSDIPKVWIYALAVMKFFLSNPFGFPEGYVPLMNHSAPFIYARIPGTAPDYNVYNSDLFPKCIESEYDLSTGTYIPVMVDWSEIQSRMNRSMMNISNQPVPKTNVNPGDRIVRR